MNSLGCYYARFPLVCSLRMFFALVGRHEERTRALLLLVSRFSEIHVTILCAITLYSIPRSTPVCQLGQRNVFVSLLELVWTLSSESAYCKCFIPLPCCFDKQMILLIMLLELSSLQPNKKKKKNLDKRSLELCFLSSVFDPN
jgi:hypothetical protein